MKNFSVICLNGFFSIGSAMSVLAEEDTGIFSDAGIFASENFSGNVTLTTDYVFRGET